MLNGERNLHWVTAVATAIVAMGLIFGVIFVYGQTKKQVENNKEQIATQADSITVMQEDITDCREKMAGVKSKVDETYEMVKMLLKKELGDTAIKEAKIKANGDDKKEEID